MNSTAKSATDRYPYPRRRPTRYVMRRLAAFLLRRLSKFKVIGRENVPQHGPLIVVANHFSPFDVAIMVACIDRPIEFLGGFHLVDAPAWLKWLPRLWGYYAVHRGSVSRNAMRAAVAVMAQNGFLMIFPEGGSWAQVLRPARPGTAFLATQTEAQLLPVGIDGVPELFPGLRRGKRAAITVHIGRPFGPLQVNGKGRQRREQLDQLGDEIMQQIALLIPAPKRGVFSDDPQIRAAAQEAAVYPYHNLHETGIPNKQ